MNFKMTMAAAAALLAAASAGQAIAQNGSYGQTPAQGGYSDRGDRGHDGYGDRDGSGHNGGYRGDDDADFGRGSGNYRFNDGDYGRFTYGDFGARGRFYQGGDVRARFERLQHFIRFQQRTGRINRWEAQRAQEMLQSIRRESRQFRRDGHISPRERMILNNRLDRLVGFLQSSRRDHDDPRDRRY